MSYKQLPEYCRPCLERLARQAMTLACSPTQEHLELALAWLDELYSPEVPPPVIASRLHLRIKKYCGNEDPYAPLKEKEIALAREIVPRLRPRYEGEPGKLFYFSLLGNAIDFFRPYPEIEAAFEAGVTLAIDHLPILLKRLEKARTFLLLTDNAGEVFFDLPLLSFLREQGLEVFYAVKPKPIQNDLSLADLERLGLSLPARVVSTGAEMVGLLLEEASSSFKELYFGSDVVAAKGMGHFETLVNDPQRELFFLLCAKCVPVARALGVKVNDYVVFKS